MTKDLPCPRDIVASLLMNLLTDAKFHAYKRSNAGLRDTIKNHIDPLSTFDAGLLWPPPQRELLLTGWMFSTVRQETRTHLFYCYCMDSHRHHSSTGIWYRGSQGSIVLSYVSCPSSINICVCYTKLIKVLFRNRPQISLVLDSLVRHPCILPTYIGLLILQKKILAIRGPIGTQLQIHVR